MALVEICPECDVPQPSSMGEVISLAEKIDKEFGGQTVE